MSEHPDLIKKTVAAVTVEHLGCREWLDEVAASGAKLTPTTFSRPSASAARTAARVAGMSCGWRSASRFGIVFVAE